MNISITTKIIRQDIDSTTFTTAQAGREFTNNQVATDTSDTYQVEKVIDLSTIISSTSGAGYVGTNQETLNGLILGGEEVVGLYASLNDVTPTNTIILPVDFTLSISSVDIIGSEFSLQNISTNLFTNTVKIGKITAPAANTQLLLTIIIFIK